MSNHATRRRRILGLLGVVTMLATTPIAVAQFGAADLAPVALDDSPVADRMLAEVAAQALDNPDRAAVLLAELLDQYDARVVGDGTDPDRRQSVRNAVLELLARDGAIREAWRDRHDDEAASILEREGAEACLRRRPMTAPGLEAGLRIAQRAIERGAPDAAIRLLDGIASWPGGSAGVVVDRMEVLRALALIAIDRDHRSVASATDRDAAIERVRTRDESLAARLTTIATDAASTIAPEPLGSAFGREWTVLWEIPLDASLHRTRTIDSETGRNRHSDPEAVRRDGTYLVPVPAVAGNLVLVNQGAFLEAVDRYTGRTRWVRDWRAGGSLFGSGIPIDLNEIVVVDGDAYTVTGHAMSGGRNGRRAIVRFDPATGNEYWSVRPDRLGGIAELEDAEPSGPPLVVGDQVLVPLRRTTSRLETIDLVVALARTDGSPRWVRTIASSGSTRTGDPRPVSRLAALDGDVLVASAAGAVARLDGLTGVVVWLRREDVPLTRGAGQTRWGWQIASPVVLDRGVATLDAARRHWQLLDPETGELLLRRPIGAGTATGAVAWLAAVEDASSGRDLLLAIGDDVVAIDPEAPESPVWSWRERARDAGIDLGESTLRQVRGRVFVDESSLLVPTATGVFAVDPTDGRTQRVLELDAPSNPVLAPDGIHAATPDTLVTAMPVLDAVATLEARIRATPEAVSQSIALLELASRIGRADLLRFAARTAVDGLATPEGEPWRGEVLDLLLATVATVDDEDGLVLLELAEEVATGVAGRARHRLALADWLQKRGRRAEAAEAWLGVMSDEDAAGVMVRSGEALEVAAGSVARSRLLAAFEADRSLRDRLVARAGVEVDAAIADRVTAEALIGLARRYPGTDAAITAAGRAIEILRDEGDITKVGAVALMVARDLDSSDARRAALLQEAAVACEDAGGLRSARVLGRLAGIDAATAPRRAMLEGVPDHLDLLEGSLARFDPVLAGEPPADWFLVFDRTSHDLVARNASDLGERWRFPVQNEHLVVGWSPDVLVWEGLQRREPFLTALDPETGEVRWSTPQPSAVLPPLSRFAVEADGFQPGGEVFLPYQVIPVPLEDGILLVRRDGAVSMLDRTDGRTVAWSRRDLLDRVYGATTGGGLVHLHGAGIDDEGDKVGRLVSLDPGTGRTVFDRTIPAGEIQWLVAGDLGRVVVGTRSEVRLLDPLSGILGGGDGWRRREIGLEGGVVGWVTEDEVVVADDAGRISVWDLLGGRARPDSWSLPEDEFGAPGRAMATIDLGDARVLHLDGRVLLHDEQGRLIGADALTAPSRRDWTLVPVDEGLLLATRVSSGSGTTLIRFQRLDPAAGLKLVGVPFEIAGRSRYDRVVAVDGHLLLSTEAETHVLPMSPPREDAEDSEPGP